MIISAFFEKHAALAAFLIYSLGIAAAVASALIHTKSKSGKPAPPLTIELPKYRLPRMNNLMREVGGKLRDFVVRAGTIVFLSCVVVYILSAVSPALSPLKTASTAYSPHSADFFLRSFPSSDSATVELYLRLPRAFSPRNRSYRQSKS